MKRFSFPNILIKISLLTSLILYLSGIVSAQTVQLPVTPSISVNANSSTQEYTQTGNTYNFYAGATTYSITYDISLEVTLSENQQLEGVTSATYNFGNSINDQLQDLSVSDNKITFNPVTFNQAQMPDGEYTFSYNITFNYKDTTGEGDANTNETKSQTVSGSATQTVKVWPEANSSYSGNTTLKSVLTGTSVNVGPITFSGGNSTSGAWTVTWDKTGTENTTSSQSTFNYQATTGESMQNNTVTATVTNNAPGSGDVTWYTQTYTFTVPTYPAAAAYLSEFPKAVFQGTAI
ncbi:MAG: hypothetical protein J1F43_01885, partial [Muribaculaceae bacterium]|nr:hypothetical protein [Muribaculaceae bacterium]